MQAEIQTAQRNPQQDLFNYQLMFEGARTVAERILVRFRGLHEQFPSEELAEAVHKLETWLDTFCTNQD